MHDHAHRMPLRVQLTTALERTLAARGPPTHPFQTVCEVGRVGPFMHVPKKASLCGAVLSSYPLA